MDISSDEFVLSSEIRGHDGSVRAVLAIDGGAMLVTGSEDGTVRRWLRTEVAQGTEPPTTIVTYESLGVIAEAEHWVVSLAAIPAGVLSDAPSGGFAAGSQDKFIRVYDLEGNRVRLLIGHTHGVISLSWAAAGFLISGSWDGTAKVWDVDRGEAIATLKGHENGVGVLGLPTGDIVTGSTGREQEGRIVDFQIRVWRDGRQVKSIKEHTGPVRSLSLLGDLGFLSSSNDGTVRAWSFDGDPLAVALAPPGRDGQPQFIYRAVAVSGTTADVVGVGEEGTAWVWRGQDMIQCIAHPRGCWGVESLANGDIVTGSQDGMVRVFTRDSTRGAPPEVFAAYASAVEEAQAAAARGGPSDDEIAKLPDWNDRFRHKGKREGMVQLFRKDGKAIAAQWSQDSQAWIEVGEVTGTANAGTIDGVSYDHVFPIEMDQPGGGVRELKIGYNNGDNPFVVAQNFINQHELSQRFLSQIADYIVQRAGQAAPTIGSGAPSSSAPSAPAAMTAGLSSPPPSMTGPSLQHFPKIGYLVFDNAQLDKIVAKLQEFSAELDPGVGLSDAEKAAIQSLVATLGATSRYHASAVKEGEMRVVNRVLSWPDDKVFPGLDLLRLTVLHPSIKGGLPDSAIERSISVAEANPSSAPVVLLSLRLIANVHLTLTSRKALVARPDLVERAIALSGAHAASANKNIRLSASTALLNLSVLLGEESSLASRAGDLAARLVEQGITPALGESADDDSLYRAIVALGTVLVKPATTTGARDAANKTQVPSKLKEWREGRPRAVPQKIQEALDEVTSVLG